MVAIVGKDQSVLKRSVCRKCASILEYTLNEVQQRNVSCMGDIDTFHYVVCPCCGNDVPAARY